MKSGEAGVVHRSRHGLARLGVIMVTSALTRTAARRALLIGLLVGLTACGGGDRNADEQSTEERKSPSAAASTTAVPEHNVEVRLQGIRDAEGKVVAGVLFRAKGLTDVRAKSAVGGFGVRVDEDPFSFVATVNDGSTGSMPFLKGPLADVSPGTYTLLMWRGPTLGPYSKWTPATEPGLTRCLVQFEVVGDDPVTTVTVTGFPKQRKPLDESMRPCLR